MPVKISPGKREEKSLVGGAELACLSHTHQPDIFKTF
jgi:hypothetical protein